jgi:hypothetical protein
MRPSLERKMEQDLGLLNAIANMQIPIYVCQPSCSNVCNIFVIHLTPSLFLLLLSSTTSASTLY